jgi:hypothetical protein
MHDLINAIKAFLEVSAFEVVICVLAIGYWDAVEKGSNKDGVEHY